MRFPADSKTLINEDFCEGLITATCKGYIESDGRPFEVVCSVTWGDWMPVLTGSGSNAGSKYMVHKKSKFAFDIVIFADHQQHQDWLLRQP